MKKTLNDLKPNDTVWYVDDTIVREHKIYSISIEDIKVDDYYKYVFKIEKGDHTLWKFSIINRSSRIVTFYINKIDALKERHDKLEKILSDTYERQSKYFESIKKANQDIYESNKEIINELKTV